MKIEDLSFFIFISAGSKIREWNNAVSYRSFITTTLQLNFFAQWLRALELHHSY